MGVRTVLYSVKPAAITAATGGNLAFDFEQTCDLDKAAPGIVFFSRAGIWDDAFATDIGDCEMRSFSTDQTRAMQRTISTEVVAQALSIAEQDVFSSASIYPFNADDAPADIADYLGEYTSAFCQFLDDAVKADLAMIALTS